MCDCLYVCLKKLAFRLKKLAIERALTIPIPMLDIFAS